MKMKLLFGVALLTLLVPLAQAESVQFTIGSDTFTVSTGTASGSCSSRSKGPGTPTFYSCFDGGAEAFGDTADGCDGVELNGQCFSGVDPQVPMMTSEVNCTGGSSYTVTTGDDEGSCTLTGSGGSRAGSCSSGAAGENTIEASCANGCGSGTGSGCCCTDNCGDTCFAS